MGYFNITNNSEYVAAKVTNYGRQKISEGNFNIRYFQIGDSEVDYTYVNTPQDILLPMDNNNFIKHPYRLSVSGTTYGVPHMSSEKYTLKNYIGAGSCGEYSAETWSACLVEGDSRLASSKFFFGYTTSLSQIVNNTTTYYNNGELFTLLPEQQTKIVILFYAPSGTTPDVKYKYEDYIYGDYEYFKITVASTGEVFTMDKRTAVINSTSVESKHNKFKYNYLLDSNNRKVGKIFVNNRIIIFDNLETIANNFSSLSANVISNFPGTIDLVRATDVQVLRFLASLPNGQFSETQNPTYVGLATKKITEIALLDENKEIVAIGKLTKAIDRIGTQVLSVKIDF
jgi:hypothetical protein